MKAFGGKRAAVTGIEAAKRPLKIYQNCTFAFISAAVRSMLDSKLSPPAAHLLLYKAISAGCTCCSFFRGLQSALKSCRKIAQNEFCY